MTTQEMYRQELLAPADTLSGYDRWAPSYDADGNPVVEATSWVLDRTPLACGDCDVVELGCGTARNAARVIAEGARSYTGVDGSLGMLHVAAARIRDPRVGLAHADLMAPWTPHRTFDIALVVLMLEHLQSHPDRVASGALAYFHEGATEVRFASKAHPVPALAAALEAVGFDVVRRDWIASDAMVTAVPRLAALRGLRVLVDMKAMRRR